MRLEDLLGKRLGRYEIQSLLGRGGMAAVYLAHDPALRRDVALKILYPQFSGDPSLAERFTQEAVLVARLDHPNIVPIYDVGETDGLAYIAMKLLRGRSLADLLHTQPVLPPAQTLPLLEQIASAVDYAHARNVVHRDIKAANIILENEADGTLRAQLADFGIAKSLEAPGMTSTGVMMGTPDYMAPEQISNQPVTGQTDIYALGALAFRCLTGRQPFEGGTEQVLLGHLYGEVPDASLIEPSLPHTVDPVLRTAMAREPARRYRTAGEFVRALRDALAGKRATSGGLGAAASTQVAAGGYAQFQRGNQQTVRSRPADQRTPPPTARGYTPAQVVPPAPEPNRNLWPIVAVVLLILLVGGFALSRALADTGRIEGVGSVPTADVTLPTQTATSEPSAAPVPTSAPAPTGVPVVVPPTAGPSATAEPTAAPSATARPSETVAPTSDPTATPEPTAAPTATPEPTAAPAPPTTEPTAPPSQAVCPQNVDVVGGFAAVLASNPALANQLGCEQENERASDVSEQLFEKGYMLWLEEGETVYTLFNGNGTSDDTRGTYRAFTEATRNGGEAIPNGAVPDGLVAPINDFGIVWNTHKDVRDKIGWGLASESGPFEGAIQTFQNGTMLWSNNGFGAGPTIYILTNEGHFRAFPDPTKPTPEPEVVP